MSTMPLCFELPGNLTIEKLINQLSKKNNLQFISEHYTFKTFYDSFDWRLYRAELICERSQSKNSSQLRLINRSNGKSMYGVDIDTVPTFANEMHDNPLLEQVIPLLEMRALLPITTLELQVSRWAVVNKQQKHTLYLVIESYTELKHRLYIEPVAGYRKVIAQMHQFLTETLELKPTLQSVLVATLKTQGRKPGDYSSKFELSLEPTTPADKAVKDIYRQLLTAMKRNEQGTIHATDSEFLHDFRVAVRRMRTGLSQFKNLLPDEINRKYREHFAWLGQITTPVRDLDVYGLNFPAYQASLPEAMQKDLIPLQQLLIQKQLAAQKELAQQLTSSRYLVAMIDWEAYLKHAKTQVLQKHPALSIKELADQRIWKTYQKVMEQGMAIDDSSAAERLHDLRKTCKKLRYLIEFFQSLYPQPQMKAVLKTLKGFQDVLGDFQDYQVQETTLAEFSVEMRNHAVAEATFLAMDKLIENLETQRCQARAEMAGRFAKFNTSKNKTLFKKLFAGKA